MAEGRASLRIHDLKSREHPGPTRLINIKVPNSTAAEIDHLAKRLNVSKTAVVIALLNEGIEVAQQKIRKG
jgi:hypothetical protein